MVVALFFSANAWAQTTVATMNLTALGPVFVGLTWTGNGTITVNGVEMKNNSNMSTYISLTPGEQTLIVRATGTAKLTSLNRLPYPNELNLLNCPALTYLDCSRSYLTELDLSNCLALTYLNCHDSQLPKLDLSHCTVLEELHCTENQLTELNLSNSSALKELDCGKNQLTKLDLSGCTALTELDCYDNPLTELNLSVCTNLETLQCSMNQLTELNLSDCTALKSLSCHSNQLTNLDISKCTRLMGLRADNQYITLAEVPTMGNSLTIANPITYNGSKVSDISNVIYSDGNITWSKLTGASGNAWSQFRTSLPSGVNGQAFSGTITQPWVYNEPPLQQHTISVSVNNNAFGTVSGGGTFTEGASVTVTATPRSGYRFVNWTEAGSPVSTNTSYTFTVSKNRTLVANFEAIPSTTYTITVSSNNTNQGTVAGGGTFTEGTSVTVTATPRSGHRFVNWTEAGSSVSTDASYTFTVNKNRTLVANFEAIPAITYTIAVSSNNTNQGTVSGGGTFTEGASATVTATPRSGHRFVNWTEAGSSVSTNTSYTFTVSKNRTLVANFEAIPPTTYSIAVSSSNTTQGTVSGSGTFTEGASVTVTATPRSGYRFVNWTEVENPVSTNTSYTFTVSKNRTLVANFEAIPAITYTIAVSSNNTNQGTVSGGGTFTEGASVTITATPRSGYRFVNWTEAGSSVSTNASYTFTVSKNRTLVANFEVISIVIEEPDPIGEDGKGNIDFSLEIPTDATITGTFEIKLPEGYTLDESATKLIEALAGHFDLVITFKEGNIWQIEIKSKGLRAATAVALTKIMDIAYTVDPATPKGKYDIEISHIELDLSDGTSINDETITVTTEVIYSTTGIDDLQATPQIWSAGGQAHIRLPETANVQIITLTGATIYSSQLSAGTHDIAVGKGVYIVKAGSTVKRIKN